MALGLVAALRMSVEPPSVPPPPPPTSVVLVTPDPDSQPRTEVRLSWQTVQGWTYDVHVADDDLRLVHAQRAVPGGALVLPPEKTRGLQPGSALTWRVQGTAPDGSTLSSPTGVIRLE